MMKTLQNKKTLPKGRNGKYEREKKKKKSIRSFTELKKTSPMVFHLNQTVSQIIKMFAKLFNYHAVYNTGERRRQCKYTLIY